MNGIPKTTISTENEIVIYAEIGDFKGLDLAVEKEQHIQPEATLGANSRCRVRKVIKNDLVKYEYTIKIKKEGEESNISSSTEYNIEVDENFYDGFCLVADRLVHKCRYIFLHSVKITIGGETIVIENVKHEVDVYRLQPNDTKGITDSNWCKIDIEIDVINKYIEDNYPDNGEVKFTISVKDLPFKPKNCIMKSTASIEQKTKLKELWEKEFSTSLVN